MQIGSTMGVGAIGAPATKTGFSDLTSEQFLKIMFTELTNQDPLKPQDTTALLQQIQSLRQIESDLEMQQTLTDVAQATRQSTEALAELHTGFASIMAQNRIASAGSMIGREVSGMAKDGSYASGTVDTVRISGDSISLLLTSGGELPLSNIIRVS